MPGSGGGGSIRAIDAHTVHRITSGQVVIDLQSAVKELVENSLDAGATAIEVRFQNYGLKSIEVVDNGVGIAPRDYEGIALKHYTSKLSSFEDVSRIHTFGFRGEALSSLCALSDGLTIATATASEAPMGTVLEVDGNGRLKSKKAKVARQRGTTVTVANLFRPLPVRRKELERNIKREFQKALSILHAYALVPCSKENKGVRLTVTNQMENGRKVVQLKTDGTPSLRASVTALWGTRALDNVTDLDLSFHVETEKSVLRRQKQASNDSETSPITPVRVQGLMSKFTLGAGRTTNDRQYFFINGRPYNAGKVQKAFNEVYRTFNISQAPFVIADFVLPTHACDINVSPDKRTIFLHSENNFVLALKESLEKVFSSARSTYEVNVTCEQSTSDKTRTKLQGHPLAPSPSSAPSPGGSQSGHRTLTTGDSGSVVEPLTSGGPHNSPEPSDGNDDRDGCRPPSPTLVAPAHALPNAGLPRMGKELESEAATDTSTRKKPTFPPGYVSDDMDIADEELGVENGMGRKGVDQGRKGPPSAPRPRAPFSTSEVRGLPVSMSGSEVAPVYPDTDRAKPRSAQTVLNTSGAVWNLKRVWGENTSDGGGWDGRLAKRAKVTDTGPGRGDLSRFVAEGTRRGIGKGGDDGSANDSMEVDEDENTVLRGMSSRLLLACPKKKSPREPSLELDDRPSSQDTLCVASEDEGVPGIEVVVERAQVASKPRPSSSRAHSLGSSLNQRRSRNLPTVREDPSVTDLTPEGRDVSPTLVESHVPDDARVVSRSGPCKTPQSYDDVILRVDLDTLRVRYKDLGARSHLTSSLVEIRSQNGAAQRNDVAIENANLVSAPSDEIASAALSRIISKGDFMHMDVVGQFNLGFIIVRKRTPEVDTDKAVAEISVEDDLFVVDQHAADEKWNFETLQETTAIESQRLFRPRPLNLTAADELVALENMDVLKRNGFEVGPVEVSAGVDHQAGAADIECDEEESSPNARLHLMAQPISKDTVFDMKDLEELIHLMQDRPRGTMVRCSKARAMFAMRACRRSVMIGRPLDKLRMTTIVRHMASMDQPWNCPHGRPTMRHLSDLTSFGGYDPPSRTVNWQEFGAE